MCHPHTTKEVRKGTLRGCALELINHMARSRIVPEKIYIKKKSEEKGSHRQEMSKMKMFQFCIVILLKIKNLAGLGVQG